MYSIGRNAALQHSFILNSNYPGLYFDMNILNPFTRFCNLQTLYRAHPVPVGNGLSFRVPLYLSKWYCTYPPLIMYADL